IKAIDSETFQSTPYNVIPSEGERDAIFVIPSGVERQRNGVEGPGTLDLKSGHKVAWLNMLLLGPSTPFRSRSTPLRMTLLVDLYKVSESKLFVLS
ncbi:MAG: hypothetical protein IJS41_09635, partial [Clostridia bacterium]|nr:hypothetical protein [Clostridia bacterium]